MSFVTVDGTVHRVTRDQLVELDARAAKNNTTREDEARKLFRPKKAASKKAKATEKEA